MTTRAFDGRVVFVRNLHSRHCELTRKEKLMRRVASIVRAAAAGVLVIGTATVAHPSRAQDAGMPNTPQASQDTQVDQATEAQAVTAILSVQKIDKSTRMLTLKTPDGRTFDAKAGPDIDMGRLHVGDPVQATYFEEIAVALTPAGSPAANPSQTVIEREGVTAQQATLTARVISIDPAKETVTLRDPQGKMHSVKVNDPHVQAELNRVKPGDNVDVTYTQAVAISLQPTTNPSTTK